MESARCSLAESRLRRVRKEAGRLREASTVQVRADGGLARVLALVKKERVPEYSGGRFGQVQCLCEHRGQEMSRVLSHWKAAFSSQPHICRPLPAALSCSWGDDVHTKWGDSLLSTGQQHPTLSLPGRMSQQGERGQDKGTDVRLSYFPLV